MRNEQQAHMTRATGVRVVRGRGLQRSIDESERGAHLRVVEIAILADKRDVLGFVEGHAAGRAAPVHELGLRRLHDAQPAFKTWRQ